MCRNCVESGKMRGKESLITRNSVVAFRQVVGFEYKERECKIVKSVMLLDVKLWYDTWAYVGAMLMHFWVIFSCLYCKSLSRWVKVRYIFHFVGMKKLNILSFISSYCFGSNLGVWKRQRTILCSINGWHRF